MNQMDLDTWVLRSREGEVAAFDCLVRIYYRFIFNLAFRMLGSRDAAEDAVQEIFLKAWHNVARFRGASQFSTWLHSIAVRHCLDLSRKRALECSRLSPLTDLEKHSEYEDGLMSGMPLAGWVRSQTLREALAKLPDKIQIVLVMRYYSDYSVKEIADVLELPLRTIYSRLEIGLSRLEHLLKELER